MSSAEIFTQHTIIFTQHTIIFTQHTIIFTQHTIKALIMLVWITQQIWQNTFKIYAQNQCEMFI